MIVIHILGFILVYIVVGVIMLEFCKKMLDDPFPKIGLTEDYVAFVLIWPLATIIAFIVYVQKHLR